MRAVRVFHGVLTAHDYLYFASYDVAKIAITERVIHNFALTYALNLFSRVLDHSKKPSYDADLAKMTLFATPATLKEGGDLVRMTYNAVCSVSQKTATRKGGSYVTPDMGYYYKLVPGTKFDLYILVKDEQIPRCVIRLGKKNCVCIVESEELQNVQRREGDKIKLSHAVNPYDTVGKIEHFEQIINIPPSPIVLGAVIEGPYLFARDREGKTHKIGLMRWVV